MVTFAWSVKQTLLNYSLKFAACMYLVIFLTMAGCKEGVFTKHIKQGEIRYHVTYPALDSNNLMKEMLPDLLTITFKDDRYKSQLRAAAGIIEMAFVADANNYTLTNMVKIFGDRYSLQMEKDEAIDYSDVLPPFKLLPSDETMTIAGAQCKKVRIDFDTPDGIDYDFYYTDEIELKEPNWCTPYNEIDGVLLDYVIENYNLVMRLTATEIIEREVDDSEFALTDNYRPLTREEFDALVTKNLETFME